MRRLIPLACLAARECSPATGGVQLTAQTHTHSQMTSQREEPPAPPSARAARRRLIERGLIRSLASATVLVALYYLLPLDRLARVPLAAILVTGLVLLAVVAAAQLRVILRARYPGLRAAEALATTVPLFLLLFAAAYFVMGRASPASFSQHLTRTDSLYFTITTFSTVGYGDITAVSQGARLVVIAQIILDLLVIGLVLKLFVGAVRLARQGQPGTARTAAPRPPQRPE